MADKAPSDAKSGCNVFLLEPENLSRDRAAAEEPEDPNRWPRHLARKWTLALFFGTCLLYCARMAMPICAVSMATTFHWTKIETGLVLGGFFWGYCLTQILGGYISDKVGGEQILFLSAVSWSLITAATPLLAHLGSHTVALMTGARFLMGMLQGVFFPSLASLCSQRVLERERAILMSTLNSGCSLGTLLLGGFGSMLLVNHSWEAVFYCTGVLSGLWALTVWLCFLKGNVSVSRMQSTEYSQRTSTPWLILLKNSSVWAMIIAHMCACSTGYTLLSWLPTYFEETFPHASKLVFNVFPWLVAVPSAFLGGYLSNYLITQGYSVASVRKIMQSLAMGGSSMFIMLLSRPVTFSSAVTLVSVAMGMSILSSCGVSLNVQDLTPTCAGALYGFMNMLGAFMGLVLVSLSGYLIDVTLSWTTVFAVIVLVNSTGLFVFLVFGDARRVDLHVYSPLIVI
ncbi:voltage-gated purine nucleotide uniporter SLC17A9-like [Genypterus blacodes]|uniref:voltage-gated purine nucleotide uniporter SLC17A9-like n=1 Tax=Genypterus blacodes TaxID=154954 RepID=UPI003F76D0F4